MRDIVLRLGLLDEYSEDQTGEALDVLLEALVQTNEIWWRAHPEAPPLYRWGVNYQPEPRNTPETWVGVGMIRRQRWGIDCDDWAPARAAELRVRMHEPARVIWTMRKVRGADGQPRRIYHVLVERADGTIEDPSAVLGMLQRLPDDPAERVGTIVLRLARMGHVRTRDLIMDAHARAQAGDAAAERLMRTLARADRQERARERAYEAELQETARGRA